MKPNWKKLAKEAYEKGYRDGVKHALEWTPASSPPKESGEYIVLRVNLDKGIVDPEIGRTTWDYKAGENGSTGTWNEKWMMGNQLVTHWRELPPMPEKVELTVKADIM